MKNILIAYLTYSVSIIISFLFNFIIIENIIIPDKQYYQTNDSNTIFDIFYTLTAENNFHPFPSQINLFTTLFLGIYIGYIIIKKKNIIHNSNTLKWVTIFSIIISSFIVYFIFNNKTDKLKNKETTIYIRK